LQLQVGAQTFRFGVLFAVSKTLTGDFLFTRLARSSRKWLLLSPVLRGLLCFFGSGIFLLYLTPIIYENIFLASPSVLVGFAT
jgi:hypothetical protein